MKTQRWTPTAIALRRYMALFVLADGRARALWELALEIGLSHRALYETVRSLEGRGLVEVDRSGGRWVVRIAYPPLVTTERGPSRNVTGQRPGNRAISGFKMTHSRQEAR